MSPQVHRNESNCVAEDIDAPVLDKVAQYANLVSAGQAPDQREHAIERGKVREAEQIVDRGEQADVQIHVLIEFYIKRAAAELAEQFRR